MSLLDSVGFSQSVRLTVQNRDHEQGEAGFVSEVGAFIEKKKQKRKLKTIFTSRRQVPALTTMMVHMGPLATAGAPTAYLSSADSCQ